MCSPYWSYHCRRYVPGGERECVCVWARGGGGGGRYSYKLVGL